MSHPWILAILNRTGRGISYRAAQTTEALQDAEKDLVEVRIIELREAPDLLGERTDGLTYLQAIHRQLFQDVYVCAGDVRTGDIKKGGESFCPPGSIGQPIDMSPRRSTGTTHLLLGFHDRAGATLTKNALIGNRFNRRRDRGTRDCKCYRIDLIVGQCPAGPFFELRAVQDDVRLLGCRIHHGYPLINFRCAFGLVLGG